MLTRKLLVAFDPRNPEKQSNDFLIVAIEGKGPTLIGVSSNKSATAGLVVYTGTEIGANDLFKRIVDRGRRIDDVEQTLRILERYVRQLQEFRIGNILSVVSAVENRFNLVKLSDTPPRASTS